MVKSNKNHFFDKKSLWGFLLMLVGLATVFLSGSFNKETDYEKIAHYASKVVNENTINKKYCSITVEATKDSGAILNHYSEFNNLYGTFRQTKITFGSMVNLYNDYNIHFDDFNSDNLSIFYLGPNGYKEYDGHFKHYIYPFEFMFAGDFVSKETSIFISKTHAEKLLISKGIHQPETGDFAEDTYRSLLGETVKISIDGVPSLFSIQNIFYETNYYYDAINEIAGEFVLCSYSLPNGILSNLKNIYFFSEYDYQNVYFMKYINEGYSNHKYIVRVNHHNIVGQINDAYLTSFYSEKTLNNAISYLLLVFSIALMLVSLILFYFSSSRNCVLNIGILVLSILPYLIFLLISKITGDISLFSSFSTKANMFVLLIFYLLYFLVLRVVQRRKQLNSLKDVYEIDI